MQIVSRCSVTSSVCVAYGVDCTGALTYVGEVSLICCDVQNAYRHLQRNGAFEEVRFIVKRSKAHVKASFQH